MELEQLEKIARQFLNIETLVSQNNDSLDFHDCSVIAIKRALMAAYEAGQISMVAENEND